MKQQKFYKSELADKEREARFLASGHVWKEDEDGAIDTFSYSEDHHNGPECIVCGYFCCWHCEPNPPKCNPLNQ